MKDCECGCDEHLKEGNRYIKGHNRKGKKHNINSKNIMSKSQKKRFEIGFSWSKGLTKESDKRLSQLSESKKGKKLSDEHRANLSKSHKGLSSGMKNKKHSEKSKKKISEAKIGKPSGREGKEHTEQTKEELSKINKGKKLSQETKIKISKKMKGRIFSADWKKKLAKRKIENWQDIKYVKKIAKSLKMQPNKPETLLQNFLNKLFPGEYKFVGDGQIVIAGKMPDFININGQKKIIELYGDYWHQGQDPQDRIDIFKPYGYDTLIIWESALKDMDKVRERLEDFHGKKM